MRTSRVWRAVIGSLLFLACAPGASSAQYFGRNKVQYRAFDFQILKTAHFDLYYYPEEQDAAEMASRLAERWYVRLSRFFDHQLRGRQVLILYAAPAHFRQTNAIEGLIGEGTGGVTEAFKRRIVLPMAGTLADTDHVIGHELVHAFQFDITGADSREDQGGAPGILQYPLWFVEGMAEYLSLGPVDAQTAMWMRDAALREKLPKIEDLEKPEYFPYRWGHAFWAFIGAKYGDRAVASLVRSAANPRFDLLGLARQLGTEPDQLNADWHQSIQQAAEAALAGQPALASEVRRVISRTSGGGRYNIGPRISPDGRTIAFFSERDRFSIDLYLADAKTGRIERKLVGSATDPHFDSLQFLNSAGAWSPDGRQLALTAVRGGASVLALIDPKSGRTAREIELPGLADAINPAFSPDGRSVVLSGNRGGFVDLYLLSLDTGRVEPLTHDGFADLEPTFTPDGRSVVFVTERFTSDLTTLTPGPLRLARLTLATREVTPVAAFLKGKHLSPQVSADGKTLTFIAEPDGISNLYRMGIDGGPIAQISAVATGVAGITTSSPALSMATDGRLALSVFEESGDAIYLLDPGDIASTVPAEGAAAVNAAMLAVQRTPGDVQRMLADASRGLPATAPAPPSVPYSRKLTLDFLAQPFVSAGVSQFGGFVSGGMSAFFSDMLGDRALGVSGRVSGGLADLGGAVAYMNRRHRWNWAAVLEQTPYRVDYLTVSQDPSTDRLTFSDQIDRQIVRGVTGVTSFPFSQSSRVEFSASARALTFQREVRDANYTGASLQFVNQDVQRLPAFATQYQAETTAALVFDTSYFGATSPIYGRRYRLQVGQSAGSLDYTTVLADWRQYFMPKRPVTLAFRVVHYGRYGSGAEAPELISLYAGYPELVHGYGIGSFSPNDCEFVIDAYQCNVAENLVGSRLLVANAEVRAPLVGLFRGDLQYGPFPVEVAAFMDAGTTWTSTTRPTLFGGSREMLRSVGGAVRINAFGLLIVEIAASRPLDRPDTGWRWQVGVREGF
jgi:Tol biopolymer transport system component